MRKSSGYYALCADVKKHFEDTGVDGKVTPPLFGRITNSLYKAGYRSMEQVLAASEEDLLALDGVTASGYQLLMGREPENAVPRGMFRCQRCGEVASSEGAHSVSCIVRDVHPKTKKLAISRSKRYRLCPECGERLFKAVEEEVDGS